MSLSGLFVCVLSLLVLQGCGSFRGKLVGDRQVDYKREKQAQEDLEIPPDLTRSSINDTLVVPEVAPPKSAATYSEYISQRSGGNRTAKAEGPVLPSFDDVSVKRDRNQRWLVIRATPDQVWPKVVDFWRSNGILLIQEDPEVGVMETGWIENRANIKSDFITDTLRGFLDGLYASATRDQFRVRLEPGEDANTTELFLTQRGMEEMLVAQTGGESDRPVWQSRPNDPGLEAEMLRRIMVYMGVADQRAKTSLAQKEEPPRSQMVTNRDGLASLTIDENFARSWRLTGVALDRVGFSVEDRIRSEGVYYVSYNDPSASQPDEGLLSKLAFWRKDDEIKEGGQYRISLQPQGDKTQVNVLDASGKPDNTSTARRILTLLHEQIR